MAVIGARPATGIGILPRRTRAAHAAPRRRVAHAGAGRRHQAGIAGTLASIVAAAGLAFFYLTQSSNVAAVGYEIDGLRTQLTDLQAEQQRLVLQIGSARAPSQVLAAAQRDLHLVELDPRFVTFATPRGGATASASPEPSH